MINEELSTKLTVIGLSAEHIAKLEAEGVKNAEHLALLTAAEIKTITGCGLISAKEIELMFKAKPVETAAAEHVVGAATETIATAADEIPPGGKPTPNQMNDYAKTMGMDAGMFQMFMMSSMMGNTGMSFDISGMMPIAQIVAGYNPKRRDMSYMVMGQLETRLGTPIVVIDSNGAVNHELTTKYIQGLDEGFEAADSGVYDDDDGVAHEIIKVGVDAQSIYDADPLSSSKALQMNGLGTGRVNWNKVSLEVRQMAFYAVQTGELNPNDSGDQEWLRSNIKTGMSKLSFSGKCPKAISLFNEAARSGALPTLRVQLSRSARRKEIVPRRRAYNGPREGASPEETTFRNEQS